MIDEDLIKDVAEQPWTNQLNSPPLSTQEQQELKHAQRHGYLLIKGRRPRLSTLWLEDCHSRNFPFIRVRTSHKFGTVYVKLSPNQHDFSSEVQDAIGWLGDSIASGHVLIGSDYVLCQKVPFLQVEMLARVVLWIITGSIHVERACA